MRSAVMTLLSRSSGVTVSQMRLGERGAECEMLLEVYGPSSCVSEMFGKVAVDRVPACDKAWH
jgi:hypothetical protein